MNESIEKSSGNELPDDDDGENSCILPPWRRNEIILMAFELLDAEGYYEDGFDYRKMIASKGIRLKKFSDFSAGNIARLRKLSENFWNEGLCSVFPDPVTGRQCRMIVYNEKLTESECMQVILHEFGHLVLHHTQQSINGEIEATCFALAMSVFIMMEQTFHVGRNAIRQRGRRFLRQGVRDILHRKEAV